MCLKVILSRTGHLPQYTGMFLAGFQGDGVSCSYLPFYLWIQGPRINKQKLSCTYFGVPTKLEGAVNVGGVDVTSAVCKLAGRCAIALAPDSWVDTTVCC